MIIDRQFHNIKCDACGRLIDDETWWDDKDALTTQILVIGWQANRVIGLKPDRGTDKTDNNNKHQ